MTRPQPGKLRGNHALIRRISLFFEFDSKEYQPITNPGANSGRILSDATSKHQRVHSTNAVAKALIHFLI
jgi:hypothetical protein